MGIVEASVALEAVREEENREGSSSSGKNNGRRVVALESIVQWKTAMGSLSPRNFVLSNRWFRTK